jgi:hypothetical protein
MNDGVLKFVFLLVVKDDTLVIHEVEEADLPDGAHEELEHKVVHPFLGLVKKLRPRLPVIVRISFVWIVRVLTSFYRIATRALVV